MDSPQLAIGAAARIPSLDGLRGILLLLVLQAHLAMSHFLPAWLRASPLGFAALTCFFVISGYLITRQLIQEREKSGEISVRRFYVKRAFRILPVVILYMAVLLALRAYGVVHVTNYEFVRASTFSMNYLDPPHRTLEHLWSLSVEEQFYLIWPLMLVALSRRSAGRLCVAVVILCPILRALAWHAHMNPTLIPRRFEMIADGLAYGCLLALSGEPLRGSAVFRRVVSDRGACVTAAVMLVTVLVERFRPEALIVGRSIVAAGGTIVISWLITNPARGFGRISNHPIPVFLGRMSYSVYVWQQLFCMPTPGEPILLGFPANIVATFALAVPTYFFVESKMIILGKRLAHHLFRRAENGAISG